MATKWVLPLFGVGVLAASLLGNWILYSRLDSEKEKSHKLELSLANTTLTLEHKIKEQQENDQKVLAFQQEIKKLSAQRDLYYRRTQEAMKKDEKFNSWANTELPDYARAVLARVRQGNSASASNSGK